MANEFKVKNGLLVSGSANIVSSGSYIFSVDGNSGRLVQVDDGLQSGSIYSVNTISGLPILDVFADSTVRISKYGKIALFVSQSKVGIGKEYPLNGILDVSGSTTITGSIDITSTLTASLQQGYIWVGNSNNRTYIFSTWSLDNGLLNQYTASNEIRWTNLSNITGSYADTGSNIFTDTQIISSSNFNILLGETNLDSYSQINILNDNSGINASSDIVATNDAGTETGNYVDLGINSSGFGGLIGFANDAYLYTTGSDFYIGNTTRGNKAIKFFSGNDATLIPLQVSGSTITAGSVYGDVGITGSLDASGNVTALKLPMTIDAAGQTIAATALTDINGLTDSIAAGSFIIDAWIFGQSSTGTAGVAFAVSSSGTVSKMEIVHSGQLSATTFGATALQTVNNTVSTTYMTTATSECWIHIAGKLITTTAGNITIRGQKLSTGNLIVRSGSFMSVTRIA